MPFLAWSEYALEFFSEYSDDTMARLWILHQPFLFFPLLIFVRLSWTVASLLYQLNFKLSQFTPLAETLAIILHVVWLFILPLMWLSPTRVLTYIVLSQSLGGLLLAIVFVLNHNGLPVFEKEAIKTKGFYELQVVTSRNVHSSPFLDWITGGLNYQIEHHLFPTLPRPNYWLLAPYVQEICNKHGIPYRKTSFRQGVVEVLDRLREVSYLVAQEAHTNMQIKDTH